MRPILTHFICWISVAIFGLYFPVPAHAKSRWLSACMNLLFLPPPELSVGNFTDDKIIEAMQSSRILYTWYLKKGSTQPLLIDFENELRGIFKRCRGTDCRAEIAAYKLSRYLGFNLVPETTLLTINFKNGNVETGSVQHFVPVPDGFSSGRLNIDPLNLLQENIFDFLTSTYDRGQGNRLITSTGRLILVDHGNSFKNSSRNQISDQAIEYLKSKDGQPFYQKIKDLNSSNISQILPELSADQLKDLLSRIDIIIKRGEQFPLNL